jgi:hypothetical protein
MMDKAGLTSKNIIRQMEREDSAPATMAIKQFKNELKEEKLKLINEFNDKYSKDYKDTSGGGEYGGEYGGEGYGEEDDYDDEKEINKPSEVKQEDITFIESILDYGIDVNLVTKSFSWQEDDESRVDDESNNRVFETVLHRAIICN